MPSFLRGVARNALLTAGVVAVSLVALYPRVTIAEEVSDAERVGESDEDGQRFGDIVIKGELVAAANAPGGYSLVRTAENKSDAVAEADVEERIVRTDAFTGSRTGGMPTTVVTRHQKIRLGPHEKKVVGTTFAKAIGEDMTRSAKLQQGMAAYYARLADDDSVPIGPPPMVAMHSYWTEYYRALKPGEVAQRLRIGEPSMESALPPGVVAEVPKAVVRDPIALPPAPPQNTLANAEPDLF